MKQDQRLHLLFQYAPELSSASPKEKEKNGSQM
jgi:hypothetical protein